jgi:hypothetical protein
MSDQPINWPVMVGTMIDQTLGSAGDLFKSGAYCWASFKSDFTPLGSKVIVLVDVVGGCVPSSALDLYREIEATYPKLVPAIGRAVSSRTSIPEVGIEKRFRLEMIDIRSHIRPSACVLHYRTDREFDWYVRVSGDYRVEVHGERD